ncbi:hypothetical protein CLU88_2244 [Acidovorax sp. 56]|nr:hypothetical protein CLU88_2244 [Acidovorax sp. 56]
MYQPCFAVYIELGVTLIDSYYFSIRVLVNHPSMSVADLTRAMGADPDHSRTRADGLGASWSMVDETTGKRDFFSEVSDVISWLETRSTDLQRVLATGGSIEVIVQLPGDRNTGDSWKPADMGRAAALGVSLGIEVFPRIRGVTSDA